MQYQAGAFISSLTERLKIIGLWALIVLFFVFVGGLIIGGIIYEFAKPIALLKYLFS
jgi:hypothetical protein